MHTKSFLLLVAAQAHPVQTRLGITVTRQVTGAVGRNRIKRVVREVFRQNRALFPHADIVVIAKRFCGEPDYADVRAEMISASPALHTALARRSAARGAALAPRGGGAAGGRRPRAGTDGEAP